MKYVYDDRYRPKKRKWQQAFTKNLIKYRPKNYQTGNIFILCGPDPLSAIKQYYNFSNDNYILVDTVKKNIKKAQKILPTVRKETNINCFLEHDNIFNLINSGNKCISGLDLDFCETLNLSLITSIRIALETIIKNNTLPCFWVRITTSPRMIGGIDKTHKILNAILNYIIAKTDYKLKHSEWDTYGDTSTMHIWQGYFINTGFKAKKEERKMETLKTLKQLTSTEQAMVKFLAKKVTKDFSLADVAKVFNLKDTSVAALKAHQTMRKRYK